jgi:uncharacterized membrane protein YccC
VELTTSITERTTAATDALLALAAFAGVAFLSRVAPPSLGRSMWQLAFVAFGLAASLGAITHGLELEARLEAGLWQVLYMSLGAAVALFVVGAVHDWRGPAVARRVLGPMLVLAVLFYIATRLAGGEFIVFIVFEALALVCTLAVYTMLARRGRRGAALVAIALAISIVAGVIQATNLAVTIVWELDHNGLYHLVQLVGVLVLLAGLRHTLRNAPTS